MSIQTALQFIQKVRQEEQLKNQIQALEGGAGLADLVSIGAATGFIFTAAELQQAHKHDWAMRWIRRNHTKTLQAQRAQAASSVLCNKEDR